MSGEAICAAPGCGNPVVRRRDRPGRPPIYCCPSCRPSQRGRSGHGAISVEIDQEDDDALEAGRTWVVRLRRGRRSVIVGRDLGRFTATALTGELRQLLHPRAGQKGGSIE